MNQKDWHAVAGNPGAVFGDLKKLLPAGRIGTGLRLFAGQLRIAFSVNAGSLAGDDDGLEEMRTLRVIGVSEVHLAQGLRGLSLDGF